MLASKRRAKALRFELIPMIDIFMILSLFLAVMAFLPQINDSLKAELPSSRTSEKTPPSVIVQIATDGKIQLSNQSVDIPGLERGVRGLLKGNPETAIILAADKNLSYEKVIDVVDTLKGAGVKRLALATVPK
ncbi:MAG TPA: hypothetical protein DD435_02560 [Cyanobacteria bacterium UBA8530]|nr:hypothetical protein [Cyanobacteria bacterium UBA8530]